LVIARLPVLREICNRNKPYQMKQPPFFQKTGMLIRFLVLKAADTIFHPLRDLPELDFNYQYDPGIL